MEPPRLNSWWPLGILATVVLGVGLWSLLDRGEGLTRLHGQVVTTFEARDSVGRETLLLASGRRWEFDPLAHAIARLREEAARLEMLAEQAPQSLAEPIRGALLPLSGELEIVEGFKSDHAVLRRSVAAARELAKTVAAELAPVAAEQAVSVVDSVLEAIDDPGAVPEDQEERLRLAAVSAGGGPRVQEQVTTLGKHLRLIESRDGSLRRAVDRLTHSEAQQRLLEVEHAVVRRIDAHTASLAARQRVQFVLLVAAAAFVWGLLLQQRRLTSRLAAMNDDLESRVRQRTSQLASERALLSSLIAELPNAVFWKNSRGVYAGCNESFARLAGVDSPRDVIGQSDQDLPWDDTTKASKLLNEDRVLTTGEPILDAEFEKGLANGERREVIASKTLLYDAAKRPSGLVGIYTEVTELNRLRGRVQQSEKLQAVGQLAAGVAHEINTPMQCVFNNIDFLKDSQRNLFELIDSLLDMLASASMDWSARKQLVAEIVERTHYESLASMARGAVDDALEASQRIIEIVRAMRVMSHPGAAEFHPTDINTLVQSAATITRNRWKYTAELSTDLAADLPHVHVLSNDVSQVLLNLIVNAADATADRFGDQYGILGRIDVRTRSADGGVVIEVEDNGCGMPEEVRQRVYDPFFTTKEVGKGTGQGLSICYDVVVNKHGGRIDCDTAQGSGTTFRIWLPDHAVAAPEAVAMASASL